MFRSLKDDDQDRDMYLQYDAVLVTIGDSTITIGDINTTFYAFLYKILRKMEVDMKDNYLSLIKNKVIK